MKFYVLNRSSPLPRTLAGLIFYVMAGLAATGFAASAVAEEQGPFQGYRPLGPLVPAVASASAAVATSPDPGRITTGRDAGPPPASIAPGKATTPVPTFTAVPETAIVPLTQPDPSSRDDPLPVAYQTLDPDLWARIRRGFGMPDLQSDLVAKHEQYYATRPAYIHRMTERSSKYLYHIVEELERRKMPTELALLPFIESAFNPAAVSTAKAAGMWQFIPSTGRDYSLKQNSFRDDRRDVLASTTAALDYLQRLYGMFGDWHLALAAYNWGEGSVGRAQAKNRRNDLPGSYTSLTMPDETRNYVPKLQAIKNIVANPAAFNAELPAIPNHPYFKAVRIYRDIDVAVAARLAEVDIGDFKSLNPSANKAVIFAAGTPTILLPWDNAPVFERNLKTHIGQTTGWMVWTAPLVAKVGELARKFGMTEDRFRQVNNIPPKMVVKPGSALLVPRPPDHTTEVSEHVADNGQLNLQPELVLVKKSVRLQRAESVAHFAQRNRVTPEQVAQWNGISASGSFKAKQVVVVYVQRQARAAGKPADRSARRSKTEKTSAATRSGKSSTAKKAAKGQSGKPKAKKPAA